MLSNCGDGIKPIWFVCLLMLAAGCKKPDPKQTDLRAGDKVALPASREGAASKTDSQEAPMLPLPLTVKGVGFLNPGTVIVDTERDVYLVSNTGENPLSSQNKGFISKIATDGKVIDLKWIESGKNDIALVAPKGMAVRDETLYVADVKTIRKFDAVTGRPKGEIAFNKASHLNDIALSPDGLLYVSDTGLTPLGNTLVPTQTDCIYVIDKKDQVSILAKGVELKQPNGLIAEKDGLHVVSFSEMKLYTVSLKGEVKMLATLPGDRLDGIVRLPDESLAVTSWRGSAVYRGMPEGPFTPLLEQLNGPADLTYDAKRHRLVVPLAKDNALLIQPLGDAIRSSEPVASRDYRS